MGKFSVIPETTFSKLQMGAGILLKTFDPSTATVADGNIIGATTGGVNFSAVPSFSDMGADIDNAPVNMRELKHLDSWDISLGGTFVTADSAVIKMLIGAADTATDKVTPRNDLKDTDFTDIWWVGDYSDETTGTNAGFIAIHMMNGLSTGGFQIQSGNNAKGQFAFTFTAHYSIDEQDKVPFEVYVKAGA